MTIALDCRTGRGLLSVRAYLTVPSSVSEGAIDFGPEAVSVCCFANPRLYWLLGFLRDEVSLRSVKPEEISPGSTLTELEAPSRC